MLYIVEALRYGNEKMDSYVVGVYDSAHAAAEAMAVEELKEGSGNYDCVIHKCELNQINQEALESARKLKGDDGLYKETLHLIEKFNLTD